MDYSYPDHVEYDYIYDPEHKERPDVGYYKTSQGWSNNPRHKAKDENFETRRNEIIGIVSEAKKNGTFLKAPNGEPTKLSKSQWATVRTSSFKNWFGDWERDPKNASKIIDDNGEPLVCSHSSDSIIKRFDASYIGASDQGWYGYGFYFFDHKVDGETYHYGSISNDCFLNIRNPFSFEPEQLKDLFRKGFRFDGCEDYKITKVKDPNESFNKIYDELIGDDQGKKNIFSTLIKQYADFVNIRKNGFKDIPEEYSSMFSEGIEDVESFWFYEFDERVDKLCKEYGNENKDIDYYHLGDFAKLTTRMFEGLDVPSSFVRTFSDIKYVKDYDYEEMCHPDAIMQRGNNSYDVTKALIRFGYDGTDPRGHEDSFCVFSPNNIKSAVHNNGVFDPKSPYVDK